MPISTLQQLQQFWTRLGERCPTPADFYLFGGSALLWLGAPRQTIDIDFSLQTSHPDAVRAVIAEVAAELDLDLEESNDRTGEGRSSLDGLGVLPALR